MLDHQPLVSVIIPTFNRAHLIGDTLDSVLAQTYTNWECIIVDDGSCDNTDDVIGTYTAKDPRFKYYHRPSEHLPGGNGARNYGFKMSQGEYVNWFDSDDLMKPKRLEIMLDLLVAKRNEIKFIIDRFENIATSSPNYPEWVFSKNKGHMIDFRNYLFHKIYWGTISLIGHVSLFDSTVFDETLSSGQEYNFFVGILAKKHNVSGYYINQELVERRLHDDSIQGTLKQNGDKYLHNKFNVYWKTYNTYEKFLKKDERLFLLNRACLYYLRLMVVRSKKVNLSLMFYALRIELGLIKAIMFSVLSKVLFICRKGEDFGKTVLKLMF